MKVVSATCFGYPLYVVESWCREGVFHGFLGRELDFRTEPLQSWEKFLSAVPPEERPPLTVLQQTHSTIVVDSRSPRAAGCEGDALIWQGSENEQSPALGMKTADCFPILLASRDRHFVAAVHAGWRGVLSGILPETISRAKIMGVEVRDLEVAFGPAAQVCCFDVGNELLPDFQQVFAKLGNVEEEERVFRRTKTGTKIDLLRILELQLLVEGIRPEQWASVRNCSICEKKFFSFRREKDESGRELSFVCRTLDLKLSKNIVFD